jgi:hypothetical protein
MSWLREALEVRRRVLGPGHEETVASEVFIAEELLASCGASTSCQPSPSKEREVR